MYGLLRGLLTYFYSVLPATHFLFGEVWATFAKLKGPQSAVGLFCPVQHSRCTYILISVKVLVAFRSQTTYLDRYHAGK